MMSQRAPVDVSERSIVIPTDFVSRYKWSKVPWDLKTDPGIQGLKNLVTRRLWNLTMTGVRRDSLGKQVDFWLKKIWIDYFYNLWKCLKFYIPEFYILVKILSISYFQDLSLEPIALSVFHSSFKTQKTDFR